MGKAAKFTEKFPDKPIEEATSDAYNESGQTGEFFTMISENLSLPLVTQVLGQEVNGAKIDVTKRDEIVAIALVARRLKQFQFSICPCPTRGQIWVSDANDGRSDGRYATTEKTSIHDDGLDASLMIESD